MRAVRFRHYGGIEVLGVEDIEPPSPGPHDVLIEMRAAGINPGEAKIRTGALHERLPATFPSGQGSDLAGTVVETGTEVTRWQVGDHVFAWSWGRSSHAEYVAVPDDQLVAIPRTSPGRSRAPCTWPAAPPTRPSPPSPPSSARPSSSARPPEAWGITVQLVRHTGAHVVAIASPRHQDWLHAQGATGIHYGRRREPHQAGGRNDTGRLPRLLRRALRGTRRPPRRPPHGGSTPSTTRRPPRTGQDRTRAPKAPSPRSSGNSRDSQPQERSRSTSVRPTRWRTCGRHFNNSNTPTPSVKSCSSSDTATVRRVLNQGNV
jgi:hypothetical protein